MALVIQTLASFKEYLNGVMLRADHHGENVNEIILTLVGAVLWRATSDIEVKTYKNAMANVIWFTINDNRYALAFNHQTGSVELRQRTLTGDVLTTFNNKTNLADIKIIFSQLN